MLNLSIDDPDTLARICHALSTVLRVNIIRQLDNKVMSCLELSKALNYPLSTISSNVKVLEDAGLIICDLMPAKNGSKKMCSLVYSDMSAVLGHSTVVPEVSAWYETSIPIGHYMDFEVAPTCGYITDEIRTELFDFPVYFCEPERVNAQLLWFRKGYVEYRVPITRPTPLEPKSIMFELELCSEAPGFNNKWKSDITMWINGVEIGTWTCPSDFGDRRGRLTPDYWRVGNTQYGILTNWNVSGEGTTINGEPLSDVVIGDLGLERSSYVTMRLGVKDTSVNIGGVNIFGNRFGDYPQDIKMLINYREQMSME